MRIVLTNAPPANGLRPSVDNLLRSVRHVYGSTAAGFDTEPSTPDESGQQLFVARRRA